MRLAFVHKRFGVDGGTERFLEGLVRQLGARGHEIHVFAAQVDPQFSRSGGATFHALKGRGPGALLRALLLYWSARRALRSGGYDLVMHLGRTGPEPLYRAGGGSHRRWLDVAAGRLGPAWRRALGGAALRDRFVLWHERRALERATVVVPSRLARAELIDAWGHPAAAVEVVPNGVDLERFAPKLRRLFFEEVRDSLGLRPEELVLVFVGSDWWRKGLDRALEALAELDDVEDLRLLVLGDDARRDEFAARADALGVRGRVTFAGNQQRIERVLAACDLLLLPTRHDPFANVSLEALACGIPVVTSQANGAVSELGACDVLRAVPEPCGAPELAAELRELLVPDRSEERHSAARELAEAHGQARSAERWEALLERLVVEVRP